MRKIYKSKSLIALLMTIVFIFTNFSTAFAQVESKKNSINSSIVSENSQINIKEAISNTAQYMINQDKNLIYGKEWRIMGLSRAGIKLFDEYYENYYKSVVEEVNDEDGDFSKVTDLERIILALNSIGKDPTSVGDYNLIDKLWNYEDITKQGLTGPVFALLALDSKKYEEPKNPLNTRESLIKNILEFKTEDGGFSLFKNSKNADVDMTAMALQALSNYMDNEEVKEVVESSLKVLSENQLDNGGYKSEWSGENVQSSAQVIVALTALGKDILDSSTGFVKKDGNLLSYVMTYQNENGAFEYPKGTVNSMATEQAMYGLVSYDRFVDGKNKLYDISCEETSYINENVDLKIQYLYTSAFLKNNINKAKDYNKENYTEASFNLLESAISKGEETKNNIESKHDNLSDEENKDLIETAEENIKDIDNAENNLGENKDELKKQCLEKAQSLKEKITEAENYKEEDYTKDSFNALTEVITNGKEIASKLENDAIENSSEEELQSLINDSEKITKDIESAISKLEKNKQSNLEENKDELKKQCLEKITEFKGKITEAENYSKEDYTEDSFKALTEVTTNSKKIIEDIKENEIENLSDKDIQDLIEKLGASILSIDNAIKSLEGKCEEAKITFSVEIRTLGQSDIISPTEVNIKEGETVSEVLNRILKGEDIKFKYSDGLLKIKFPKSGVKGYIEQNRRGVYSGWMYNVNGIRSNAKIKNRMLILDDGLKEKTVKNGDVVRVCYTCRGCGQDIDCLDNMEKLKETIKKTEEYDKSDYTNRSFEVLVKAVESSKADILSDEKIEKMMVEGGEKDLSPEIEEDKELTELEKKLDNHIEEIKNAIKGLVKVNMTEDDLKDQCLKYLQTLKDKIEKGKTYKEKDYTEDSLNLLKDAIKNSEETISDTDEDKIKDLSKEDLENLLNTFESNLDKIDKAISNLKETNTELKNKCIEEAKSLSEKIEEGKKCNKDNYTEDSFKTLEGTISNGEKTLGDLEEDKIENLSKEQLQDLIKTAGENIECIENAINNLKETSIELKNKCIEEAKLLNEKIEEGKKHNKEDYTEDSFKTLEDAIANGEKTISNINDDVLKNLSTDELKSLIKTVGENKDNIDAVINSLKETSIELKNKCLEEVKLLKQEIEKGKQHNKEDYTENSFKSLKDAIENAEVISVNIYEEKLKNLDTNELQSLIDKIQPSIDSIENAIKALEVQTKVEKVTFSIERRVLGQPDIMPPTEINVKPSELTSVVLDRILKEKNIKYKKTGEIRDAFYLASMMIDGKWLGEFDHGQLSGWMYSINGSRPNVGMAGRTLKNGDVVRIYYTCKAFGQDIDCVDKIFNLRDKVKEAKEYKKEDYTSESFNVLSEAIKSAEADTPSDEQIGKIMSTKLAEGNKIKSSFLAKGGVTNAIAIAKEGDSGTWVPELDEELAGLSHKFEKHIVEIDNAIKALVKANMNDDELKNYCVKDFEILKGKINEGKKYAKDIYTEESFTVLQDAIAKGEEVANNIDKDKIEALSKEDVENLIKKVENNIKAIDNAISNLEENNNNLKKQCLDRINSLEDTIKKAKKYDKEKYTEETFKALQESIDNGNKEVNKIGDKLDSYNKKELLDLLGKLESATIDIQNSINNLEKNGDDFKKQCEEKLDDLKEKIKSAKEFEEDKYTEETFKELKDSIEEGEKESKDIEKDINKANSNKLKEFIDNIEKKINSIEDAIDKLEEKPVIPSVNVDEAINNASKWILKDCPNPTYSKEWYILGLARGGYNVPSDYYEKYYASVEKEVQKQKGNFRKVTDLERIILAVTAIGKDPTDVGGYNLIDILFNYKNVNKQGLNGPVFALIALDTNGYSEPAKAINTRDSLIKEIMKYTTRDGGFSLFEKSKSADVDMTAMTLQALSNYTHRSDVKRVVDSSLKILSKIQLDNGGYKSDWSGENVQSPAQVIVALTALGKDIMDPENGFVKEDGNLLSYVMTYKNENGAFEHPKGTVNGMATEQSLYTLVSYKRFCDGKTKLYDMSDVSSDSKNKEDMKNQCNKKLKTLKDKIKSGNEYKESDYTKDSFKKLKDSVKDAEKDLDKLQKEIDNGDLKSLANTLEKIENHTKDIDKAINGLEEEIKVKCLNKLKELKDCLKEAKEYKDVDYTDKSYSKLKSTVEKISKYIETTEKNIEKETNKDKLGKSLKTMEGYLNELDDAVRNLKKRPSENLEIKNNDNNIKVNFNTGVLPENSVVTVKNIIKDDASKYTDAKQILNKFNNTSNLISLYDIKIEADGKTIEPKDYVTVSITLPEDYVIKDNKIIKVVKLLEDGSAKEFDCKVDGKNVVFKTKGFSLYSIIEIDKEDKPSNENKPNDSNGNKEESDNNEESNVEVSDNDNSNKESNTSHSSNDSGSSSNKKGLKSRNRGSSNSVDSEDSNGEDEDEDADEDEEISEEEDSDDNDYDKEMIEALKENNGDLRETISEFKNIYGSNMNKTIGGLVGLILISNIGIVLFMRKKK